MLLAFSFLVATVPQEGVETWIASWLPDVQLTEVRAICGEQPKQPLRQQRLLTLRCLASPRLWTGARSVANDANLAMNHLPLAWRTWWPTVVLFEGSVDHDREQSSSWFARNIVLIDGNLSVSSDKSAASDRSASLRLRDLRFAQLFHVNLDSADLTGADLRGADLRGATLRGANLTGADFQAARLDGAQLRGANLSSARLDGAGLGSADLNGAVLSWASLDGANLGNARAVGADFFSAYMRAANLSGAVLQGARLRSAELFGSDAREGQLVPT